MIKITTTQVREEDLINLCKKKGISPRQLAIKAGVNYSFLNKVINGHYSISEETWDKLKKHL